MNKFIAALVSSLFASAVLARAAAPAAPAAPATAGW